MKEDGVDLLTPVGGGGRPSLGTHVMSKDLRCTEVQVQNLKVQNKTLEIDWEPLS